MRRFLGEQLRSWRERKGISGNRLAILSGISQATLNGIERGKRPASDANLSAIANVPEMEVELDRLKAWRDLDRIGGPDGLKRLIQYGIL